MTENTISEKSRVDLQRDDLKRLVVEQLKKTPIVQVVCEKVGIGRASFYRWKKEDKDFSQAVDEAQLDGNKLVNDMAESQLMAAIRDKNMTAIIFWLKAHHSAYATKVEISRASEENDELTPEQQKAVEKVLKLLKEEYGK